MSVNISNPAELQRLLDRTGLERAGDGVGFVLKREAGNAERGMILCGVEQMAARGAHKAEVAGSSPAPATTLERIAA